MATAAKIVKTNSPINIGDPFMVEVTLGSGLAQRHFSIAKGGRGIQQQIFGVKGTEFNIFIPAEDWLADPNYLPQNVQSQKYDYRLESTTSNGSLVKPASVGSFVINIPQDPEGKNTIAQKSISVKPLIVATGTDWNGYAINGISSLRHQKPTVTVGPYWYQDGYRALIQKGEVNVVNFSKFYDNDWAITKGAGDYNSYTIVLDSRGYQAEAKEETMVTVYEYIVPSLTNIKMPRNASMNSFIPQFDIAGTTSIGGIGTGIRIDLELMIDGLPVVVSNIQNGQEIDPKVFGTNGISPFQSYQGTVKVYDTVKKGGKATDTPTLKNTYAFSSNISYTKPSMTASSSNFGVYYDGSLQDPPEYYDESSPWYHKDLRLDFMLSGTMVVKDPNGEATISNLTRVDMILDNQTYRNVLGGSGANTVGIKNFITRALNSGNGINLNSNIAHTGTLELYDSANGMTTTDAPISTIAFATIADRVLLDIDGDIDQGGGIGIGGYHENGGGYSLDIHGKTRIERFDDDKSDKLSVLFDIDGDIQLGNGLKLLDTIWPIGCIYTTLTDTNPAETLGFGKWNVFGTGRTIVAVDPNDPALAKPNVTGGSVNPLTKHNHTIKGFIGNGSNKGKGDATKYGIVYASRNDWAIGNHGSIPDNVTDAYGYSAQTGLSANWSGDNGANTDHKNWQPYKTVYMWNRVE